jgi:hypothetical protein
VNRTSRRIRPVVTGDGDGVTSHAGSALLREMADHFGLTKGLSRAMSSTRERKSAHDPGAILRDLAVMLADGGDCLSDIAVLRGQQDLFGAVASDSTVWRVLASIADAHLAALRGARADARAHAWNAGATPKGELVLDFDATLVTSYSEKEGAAPTYKRGFGFHPLACFLNNSTEALAGKLRPGNAGSNTAADHIEVLHNALAQIPAKVRRRRTLLARADSAGATHKFLNELRTEGILFSVGFDLTEPVRAAVLSMPSHAWVPACRQDGDDREGADVCELTGLDLSAWPTGTRAICRREEPHPGAQLTFTDIEGYRFQVFITDQTDDDIAYLEARHRNHARVEDRIRCAKDTGLRNFPCGDFDRNQAWLELILMAQDLFAWMQILCLTGEARNWEPKRMRYRLLHMAGRMVRSGRRLTLRLQRTWPWVDDLVQAFARLRALPHA